MNTFRYVRRNRVRRSEGTAGPVVGVKIAVNGVFTVAQPKDLTRRNEGVLAPPDRREKDKRVHPAVYVETFTLRFISKVQMRSTYLSFTAEWQDQGKSSPSS